MSVSLADAFSTYPNIANQTEAFRLVWLYVLFRTNKNNHFWRSYQTIADELFLDRRNLIRIFNQAKTLGYLRVIGKSKQGTNMFLVIHPQFVLPVDNSVDNSVDNYDIRVFPSVSPDTPLVSHQTPPLVSHQTPKRNIKTFKERETFKKSMNNPNVVQITEVLKKSPAAEKALETCKQILAKGIGARNSASDKE
jgi:hypothetical protein